jgi:hypothetical protein
MGRILGTPATEPGSTPSHGADHDPLVKIGTEDGVLFAHFAVISAEDHRAAEPRVRS